MTVLSVLTFIGKLLVALLGFGLIIFIHELGHFLVARLFGVQVNEFAIGMGPRLFKIQGKLPKKMRKTQDTPQNASTDTPQNASKDTPQNASTDTPQNAATDGGIPEAQTVPDGAEAEEKTPYIGTVYSIRLFPIGGFCAMEGEEEDSDAKTEFNPNAFNRKPVWQRMLISLAGCFMNLVLGLAILIGLAAGSSYVGTNQIALFNEGATSNAAGGLAVGDRILKVNDSSVFVSNDIVYDLLRDQDGKVDFLVERDGKKLELRQVPFMTKETDGTKYIQFDFKVNAKKNNVWLTVREAALNTVCYVRQVIFAFFDLLTGRTAMSALSGPVGVIGAVTNTVSLDLRPFFNLLALLTVNLGVFNLFPIPPLDGSLFVFNLLEGIFHRPVSQKVRIAVQIVGIVLLLGLMLFVTYGDISRLITGNASS